MPPSLVLHTARADPDSAESLEDIRQWQYEFTYEHLDVAQDAIECQVDYNVVTAVDEQQVANGTSMTIHPLFAALVNFTELYPEIGETLLDPNSKEDQIKRAIVAFEALVREVANVWDTISQTVPRAGNSIQYIISEIDNMSGKSVTIEQSENGSVDLAQKLFSINKDFTERLDAGGLISDDLRSEFHMHGETLSTETRITVVETGSQWVIVDDNEFFYIKNETELNVYVEHVDFHMPGYEQISKPVKLGSKWEIEFGRKLPDQAALDPIYGESSIPDRTLFIQDLDILQFQNAWATIWLTRNKELVSEMETNPKFVYQTPLVRFSNAVTPLLENNKHWDLGRIDRENPLDKHIENLFTMILPASSGRPYDIRVSCRYAFLLASGNNENEELISELPVVLGPRFTIRAGKDLLSETESFRKNLVIAIEAWKNKFKPLSAKGRYIFSISIFKADDLTLIDTILDQHLDLLGDQKIKTFIDLVNAPDLTLSEILGSSVDIKKIQDQAQLLADSTGENINLPLIKINHVELHLGTT